MAIHNMKGEWNFVVLGLYGVLSVTHSGLRLIHKLCAVPLATVIKVTKL